MVFVKRLVVFLARSVLFLVLLLIVLLFLFDAFVQFRQTDQQTKQFFAEYDIKAEIIYYNAEGRRLRALSIDNPNAGATLLFLHGAPSSMSYFNNYLSDKNILKTNDILSVDRPGYGFSGLGVPETSIHKQVEMIRPLLDRFKQRKRPIVLVGVSYGTSVACKLAMDHPELVDGIVLVAPSLAPGEENVPWIARPAAHPLLKWMIPRMFITANAEKLSHESELRKMLPDWKNISVPVAYLQGENDGLIYPSNANFARRQMVNVPKLDIQMIPDRGHLIAFSEKDRISRAITQMIKDAGLHRQSVLQKKAG